MKIRKYSLCALAVGLVFNSSASVAQETAANVERIQVTGSNIKRNDLEGSAPVQVIGREDIDRSGFANLQQLLETLPAAGTGTFSTRGNNQDSTANGGAAISLRGFGADATLVLINGRRVAGSAFAEGIVNSFVDINNIPVSAIERIEILKDGASAVYGSDAVAGVVNISFYVKILKVLKLPLAMVVQPGQIMKRLILACFGEPATKTAMPR